MPAKNIKYLKADWTQKDDAITQYLSKFQRSGVPLMVYYEKGKDPQVLPQILSPENLKKVLE